MYEKPLIKKHQTLFKFKRMLFFFRNPPGSAPLRPPEIVFVKPTPLRFVLLIEDSAVMIEQVSFNFILATENYSVMIEKSILVYFTLNTLSFTSFFFKLQI